MELLWSLSLASIDKTNTEMCGYVVRKTSTEVIQCWVISCLSLHIYLFRGKRYSNKINHYDERVGIKSSKKLVDIKWQ